MNHSLVDIILYHFLIGVCLYARHLYKKTTTMPYVLPTFNITVNFWRNGVLTSAPPDVVSLANLSPGRLSTIETPEGANIAVGQGGMWLRLPKGTDVRDQSYFFGGDTCECPAGSFRFYDVAWVDDIGGGFLNEHRFAVIQPRAPWPYPFPPVSGPFSGPPSPFIKMEAQQTSAGVAVNSITVTYNQAAGRRLWVVIHAVQPTGALTLTLNAIPIAPQGPLTASYLAGATTGTLSTHNPGTGFSGPLTFLAQIGGGGTAALQMSIFSVPDRVGISDYANSNVNNAGVPALIGQGIVHTPQIAFGAVALFGETAVGTWGLPFQTVAPDISDNFGGNVIRLSLCELDEIGPRTVNYLLNGETCAAGAMMATGQY